MRQPPYTNIARPQSSQAEHEEAAALAAKVIALPSNVEPRTGQRLQRGRAGSLTTLRRYSLWFALIYSAVWLCTLVLFAAAGLRIFYHDGTHFLIWVNAFTRYVYLPAYACLVWAAWKRRSILALANVAIVSLHIAWVAPNFVRDRRFDPTSGQTGAAGPAAQQVRIFFANVNGVNVEYYSLLQEIRAANPDVIILVEFTWSWQQAFRHSPVMAPYLFGNGLREAHPGTVNVFSRLPLVSENREQVAGRMIETIEIPLDAQKLRVIGLHAPRPINLPDHDYDGYYAHTVPKLLSEKGPLVIVGDFNATQYSRVYKQLTSDRFRSAHEDRGRGYATSWPNGQDPLPPIRIDQALLSPEIECLGISEGEGVGSDHKPLILDVRIRGPR